MKKVTSLLVSTAVLLVAFASVASAALRVPQVAFNSGSLQSYISGVGQTINVDTDQENAQSLTKSASGNTTFTIMLELAGNAAGNTIGVYDATLAAPALVPIFPGGATQGWFAVASFLSTGNVVVNLFDNNAVFQSSNVYPGLSGANFGFYISGPGGTFYQQDYRNPGSYAQALVYAGTGSSSGTWWLAFEDLPYSGGPDTDFNDAVLLLESVVPTDAQKGTWGAIKARYR